MRREPRWVSVFLKHLARTGNVRLAAEGAGVDYTSAYARRKRHAGFAEAWEEALRLHSSRSPLAEGAGEEAPPPASPVPLPQKSGGGDLVARPDGKLIRGSDARWSKRAEEAFLLELTVSANVRAAARAAGFSGAAVYKRRLKDKRFAAAWDAAVETGKARLQAHLVEAANRAFDPEDLPIGEDRELPAVSVAQAINIAKLPARDGGGSAGAGAGAGGGFARGGKGLEDRIYDETGFDMTPITRHEWDEARQNIFERLQRLREQTEEEERKTGRCRSCGQQLPAEPPADEEGPERGYSA